MSVVKSLSVGNGDMFYIKHNTDNFTIIDCCISEECKSRILREIMAEKQGKGILRFISSHPDDDHIRGLKSLDDAIGILNFYCVKNQATKPDATDDFRWYCELRDSTKAFYLFKGCSRRWMNLDDEERKNAGIDLLWPVVANASYLDALSAASRGENPNNISPIIKYSLNSGVTMLWMGDLETEFMESITEDIELPRVDILFAPHHGRDSGKVPQHWLDHLNPSIVVIGEAPSQHLNYYANYNTITQNSAGDITFECETGKVHIYVERSAYRVPFLQDEYKRTFPNYIGTLTTK